MWAEQFLQHNFAAAYKDRHQRFTEWEKTTEIINFSSIEFLELFAHALNMGCEGLLLDIGQTKKKSKDLKNDIAHTLRSQNLEHNGKLFSVDVYQSFPGQWIANIVLPSDWEKKQFGDEKKYKGQFQPLFFISCRQLQKDLEQMCLPFLIVPGICQIVSTFVFGQLPKITTHPFVHWLEKIGNQFGHARSHVTSSKKRFNMEVKSDFFKDTIQREDSDDEVFSIRGFRMVKRGKSATNCSESESSDDEED